MQDYRTEFGIFQAVNLFDTFLMMGLNAEKMLAIDFEQRRIVTIISRVSSFNSNFCVQNAYRRIVRCGFYEIANFFGIVVAICATGTVVAVALINAAPVTDPARDKNSSTVPKPIILTGRYPTSARAATASEPARNSNKNVVASGFEDRWTPATSRNFSFTDNLASLQSYLAGPPLNEVELEVARAPNLTNVIELGLYSIKASTRPSFSEHPLLATTEQTEIVPLPRPLPAPLETGPQPAVANSDERNPAQQMPSQSVSLPEPYSRTAVYDIAAHTVYLPNGERLEAHSGLANKLDDPRFVSIKNRGPTPPNIYALSLREKAFHDVQAIRLTPVGGGNMFGRNGLLAHPYMLSANGDSNGCVSVKDYPAFLHAYLSGEVDRLVVVPHLRNTTLRTARVPRRAVRQVADNNP